MFLACFLAALVVLFVSWAIVLLVLGGGARGRKDFWPRIKSALVFNNFFDYRKSLVEEDRASDKISFSAEASAQEPLGLVEKYNRMELILFEKNRMIEVLQKELNSERAQRNGFENIQVLLKQQIQDLRMQNRKIRKDLEDFVQANLQRRDGRLERILSGSELEAERPNLNSFRSRLDASLVQQSDDSEPAGISPFLNDAQG